MQCAVVIATFSALRHVELTSIYIKSIYRGSEFLNSKTS